MCLINYDFEEYISKHIENIVNLKDIDSDTIEHTNDALSWLLKRILVPFENCVGEIAILMNDSFGRLRRNWTQFDIIAQETQKYFESLNRNSNSQNSSSPADSASPRFSIWPQ